MCLLVIVFSKAYSQEDSLLYSKGFLDSINIDDLFKVSKPKSYFKIQASYLSNSVYGGRKDSLALPYFTPSIEYNHKSGAYASASFGLLPNSSFKQDFFSLDAGFTFDTSHHFGGSLFINKLFYSDSSKNVQSSVNLTTGGSLNYYTNIVNLAANVSLMFGSKTDVALNFLLDHSFNLENDTSNYALTITPTLAAYFGSTGYYQKVKARRRETGFPNGTTFTIVSPNKFQLLSYEISVPISFDKEKWGLFFTPTYTIAVNPVTTTITAYRPNGNPLPQAFQPAPIVEKISNSFYVEFGIYYKL